MATATLIEKTASDLYTLYCDQVGGKAFNGDPLPDWRMFKRDPAKVKQVNAWIAVGALVCQKMRHAVKEAEIAATSQLLVKQLTVKPKPVKPA